MHVVRDDNKKVHPSHPMDSRTPTSTGSHPTAVMSPPTATKAVSAASAAIVGLYKVGDDRFFDCMSNMFDSTSLMAVRVVTIYLLVLSPCSSVSVVVRYVRISCWRLTYPYRYMRSCIHVSIGGYVPIHNTKVGSSTVHQ